MFQDMPKANVYGKQELFPDISDGENITIYNNRVTNVTKNKAKKINDDIYVELEGDLNISPSSGSIDEWQLTNPISLTVSTVGKRLDVYSEIETATPNRCAINVTISSTGYISLYTWASGNLIGHHIKLQIVVHDQ